MAGLDQGTGVAGSSVFLLGPRSSHRVLTQGSQVSRTSIIPESTNLKTSIIVVLLVMIFNNGIIAIKSRTVSSLTSPSASLRESRVYTVKLTKAATVWPQKVITSAESSPITPTISCFWELMVSALTLPSVSYTIGSLELESTDKTLPDIPVDDLRAIFGRLSRAPPYVTQEV